MMLKLWKKRKKLDNKGMAMVLVIIAIALCTMLVSVLMTVSMLNYQMKVTEQKSKGNFYSAEGVLDQIHVGLQQMVSEATDDAYVVAMKQNNSTDTEAYRIQKFNKSYTDILVEKLRVSDTQEDDYLIVDPTENPLANSDGLYTKGLAAYLDKELASRLYAGKITITYGVPGFTLERLPNDTGVKLNNLQVGYTDDSGFYSEIQTDIIIEAPDISLKKAVALPNVFDYAIIADTSLVFETATGTDIRSSVYAGTDGIKLNASKNISFVNVNNLVSKGSIDIDNSTLTINGNNIFARGITLTGAQNKGNANVNSSSLTMDGDAYIVDDMTLNKWNVAVNLTGRYIGYSGLTGTDVIDEQSSIVLNGGRNTLDMNGLDRLILCGNAFINDNRMDSSNAYEQGQVVNSGNPSYVMMGSSVAMKTDQIVFLAPAECIGTIDHQAVVGKNPMTNNAHTEWSSLGTSTTDNKRKLDASVPTKLLNRPLSDYGLDDDDFYTIYNTVKGVSVCYVYLKFDSVDMANKYYQDYMDAASENMRQYMKKYENKVSISNTALTDMYASNNLRTQGNILTYNTTGSNLYFSDTIYGDMTVAEQDNLVAMQQQYRDTYDAMMSMLTMEKSELTAEELSKSVYYNLINTDAIDDLNGNDKKYSVGNNEAIVIDGNIEVGAASANPKCNLVIASGNVTVKGNYNGMIMAGGTVTVPSSTGTQIEGNEEVVTMLLQAKDQSGETLVATFFNDGELYEVGSGVVSASPYVDLQSIILYENWTKQ